MTTSQPNDDEIDLLALLGALIDNRWTIIATTCVAAALAVILAILSTPVYKAGAMLQVEEKAASLPALKTYQKPLAVSPPPKPNLRF